MSPESHDYLYATYIWIDDGSSTIKLYKRFKYGA